MSLHDHPLPKDISAEIAWAFANKKVPLTNLSSRALRPVWHGLSFYPRGRAFVRRVQDPMTDQYRTLRYDIYDHEGGYLGSRKLQRDVRQFFVETVN